MRKISEIIVHCTATPEGKDVSVSSIRDYHVKVKGWKDIGYHYVVGLDGKVYRGRSEEDSGAHCAGRNGSSIGVAYVGGVGADGKTPKDTRTEAQKKSLERLLRELVKKYPGSRVYGHRDFARKACPSFDATREYAKLALFALVVLLTSCGAKKEVVAERYEEAVKEAVVVESLARDSMAVELVVEADSVVVEMVRASVPVRVVAHGVMARAQEVSEREVTVVAAEHVVSDVIIDEEKEVERKGWGWELFLVLILVTLIVTIAKRNDK
ncbi:MAG: N-acetylmuramoyl-L-alanine amidase [Muribaculaceae bacterium]